MASINSTASLRGMYQWLQAGRDLLHRFSAAGFTIIAFRPCMGRFKICLAIDKENRQTVNTVVNPPRRKGRVCAGNSRRVSCAIEILSFQNFYKVLKTCSAGRKDFFNTLNRVLTARSAHGFYLDSFSQVSSSFWEIRPCSHLSFSALARSLQS